MDIIEKIYDVDWYEEILVIFTVGRVLSLDPKERTTQNFGEYQYGLYYTASEIYGYYPGDAGTPAGYYDYITTNSSLSNVY
mgnify:CR=1 FL=1